VTGAVPGLEHRSAGPPDAGGARRHAAVARRLYAEIWNEQRYDVADELFHPAFEQVGIPGRVGAGAKIAAIRGYRASFPDLRVTVDELVAAGNTVAARLTLSATDTGGFRGRAPTGRQVRGWIVEFLRFRNGLIIGDWVGADWLGVLQQLGVVSLPDP
jgi:predicted ester cyclase